MANITEVDDSNFTVEVQGNGAGLVLVDFWAPWCGPCRVMTPVIDGVATEYAGRLRVVKVDVDRSPKSADRFGVRSIPTIALFRDGIPIGAFSGAASKAIVNSFLTSNAPELQAQ